VSDDERHDVINRWHERIVARERTSGLAQAVVLASCVASILSIAVVDYLTDVRVSLAVFYLIPTVVGALFIGPYSGAFLALASSFAWVAADSLINRRADSTVMLLANGVLRFLPMLVVVVLLADLRRVLERTQRSERRTHEFLAFAAHQLRTPVAGVQATAEALLLADPAGAPDVARERLLANLAGETSRIGRLVHSLLRVTRLDHGEPSARSRVDVRAICGSEIGRSRHAATSEIEIVVAPDVPAQLDLDAHDVAEILANLLDNARRHARERVEVRVEMARSARPRTVVIRVADDGPGLPTGAEDRVFDRFVSLDRHGGSGLGLTIARGLAVKHGGTLRYDDRAFVLSLPA
jgi:signal transduction histidine kinase